MSDILNLPASLESLIPLHKFISCKAENDKIPAMQVKRIELVIEELIVNLVEHADLSKNSNVSIKWSIETDARTNKRQCVLHIHDWSHEFNPLTAPPPDISADIDRRAIGGLGLHFVCTMSDACVYNRYNNTNILRLAFNLPCE
jgi:anti-sigma regulatory factor (Ser/Thr protein kinase)